MKIKLAALALVLAACVGCNSFVQSSIYTLATAQGVITNAQAQHGAACTQNPSQTICLDINEAIAAQNAAISGLEAYCQLPVAPNAATLSASGSLTCNANPGAKAVLVSELAALSTILKNYQAAVTP